MEGYRINNIHEFAVLPRVFVQTELLRAICLPIDRHRIQLSCSVSHRGATSSPCSEE